MQGADGKCSSVTGKAGRMLGVGESNSKVSFSCRILEVHPFHSEAETVISFVWAVKVDSFTQGVLQKKKKIKKMIKVKLNFNIRKVLGSLSTRMLPSETI